MAFSGFKKPANRIVVAGEPLVHECKVEDETNMYPGRLVKKGTNDDDIVVCGAGDIPIGWLGYEQAASPFQPADVDTAYNANDRAPVLNGGRFVIVTRLAAGQIVNKGDALVAAANGEVKKASSATVTVPSGSADAVAGTYNVDGAVPAEGIIVGIAMESVDASAAAQDIMVLSLI